VFLDDGDATEFRFLAYPNSRMALSFAEGRLHLEGNRASVLSLANILLWMRWNSTKRSHVLLNELSFLTAVDNVSLAVQLEDYASSWIERTDAGRFVWTMDENDLLQVALEVHRTASIAGHEYTLFDPAGYWVEVRII
jgi:hypothetical protein